MSDTDDSPDCPGTCPTPPQLQLYQTIIFATPVLFAFFLLLLFCMLYLRRRRTLNNNSRQLSTTQLFARNLLSTPPLDHGLSRSFRQRLPTVPFDEKFAASHEDTQCAVCLGDYQPNEKLQQLPHCKHSFHVQCIDKWLANNTTCPICRTSLTEARNTTSLDSNNTEMPRAEEGRQWEERVMREIQDGGIYIREEPYIGSSSNNVASSETVTGLMSDHAINIDRS